MIRERTEIVKTRAETSSHGLSSRSSITAARYIMTSDGLSGFYLVSMFGSTIVREVRASDSFVTSQVVLADLLLLRFHSR